MDKPDKTALQLITVDDPRFTAVLDRRIGEMRHLLDAMEPTSPAVALRTLRDAFPEAPLDERVRAMTFARH
ncbi:MAG: hypothetical protein ABI399_02915 [Bauldia sp.]